LDNDTASYFSINNNTILIDFEKPVQVSVFDYFKSVELIPLETINNSLIGRLRKMFYYQGHYYVLDGQQNIVIVFDRDGKFIFKIDKRGQGPGEYPFLNDIHINPATGHLELLCAMGFVYEYDLSGKYINTIRVTNNYLRAVHEFIPLEENTTLFFAAFHHPFRLVYYDRTKEKITHEAYHESDASGGVINMGSVLNFSNFYAYKGDWHFYRPLDRQVYKIEKDTIKVAYMWDFGKFNRDVKKIHFSSPDIQDWRNLYDEICEQFPYMIDETGENNKYVIANIKWQGGDYVNVLFDKSVQQGLFIKKFTESVTIRPYIVTNNYILSYCNPGELKQYITEEMLDEPNKKVFNELKHLDANPIIIKYNFK
jgi:hypothetical protein